MLEHLPHATLHPIYPLPTDGFHEDDLPITLPPRTAARAWKAHHRFNTTSDFPPTLPSSQSTSPSRSPTFLPFFKLAKHRSISPEPVSAEEAAEFENTLTGGKAQPPKVEKQPGKLASWFSGNSEPVNITLIPSPAKEKHDPFFDSFEMERDSTRSSMSGELDTMTKRPQSRFQKNSSTLSVNNTKDPAGSNKFAFWRSRPATNSDQASGVEDDLTALDIQTALFPLGKVDYASPEDFNDLQTNAEKTIGRLQSAYQKSLQSARAITSEKNVLTDELEASQTRSEHLKLQLANMAAQSAKQKSVMESIAEELATLRQSMREDVEFRHKSLRIVTTESSDGNGSTNMANRRGRRKRQSADSFTSEESSSNSVFSQPPLGTCTPLSAADTSPELYQVPELETIAMEKPKECQNCHGVQRSEAWDVLHILNEESRGLKARIAQCESANEDALSLLQVVSSTR